MWRGKERGREGGREGRTYLRGVPQPGDGNADDATHYVHACRLEGLGHQEVAIGVWGGREGGREGGVTRGDACPAASFLSRMERRGEETEEGRERERGREGG